MAGSKLVSDTQGKPDLVRQLDFAKYGLAPLKDQPLNTWQDADIEKLIEAFASENIAPVIYGLAFNPTNVKGLLGLSHCRRCGKCCQPNPSKPEHPGVIVSEHDLKQIARNPGYNLKQLKKRTHVSKDPDFIQGTYLPLPCIFYDKKAGACRIYEVRPLVCTTFPVTDIPGRVGVAVSVGCDYGKDIYKRILDRMRKQKDGISPQRTSASLRNPRS